VTEVSMSRLFLLGLAFSILACNAGVIPPISVAARRGDLGAMRDLLDDGADPNDAGSGGTRWPPLLHAVHKHQLEAARLLLGYGGDPDSASPNGYTALMMAASEREPAMTRLLLDYGANAHRLGPGGITALSEAVTGGAITDIDRPVLGGCHPETVGVLLDRVPDLKLPGGLPGREAQFFMRLHAGLQKMRNLAVVPTTGEPPITDCGAIMAIVARRSP
jgi:ankyrin repeat protein